MVSKDQIKWIEPEWFIWLSVYLQFKQGKVGPDGKELNAQDSPNVNGYGFEGTPCPSPGK